MCPEMPDAVYGGVKIQRPTNHFPHGVFLSFLTPTLVCLPQVCVGWLSHDQEAGRADARTKHHPCAHHQPWAGQQGRHDPRDQGPTRSNKVQEESSSGDILCTGESYLWDEHGAGTGDCTLDAGSFPGWVPAALCSVPEEGWASVACILLYVIGCRKLTRAVVWEYSRQWHQTSDSSLVQILDVNVAVCPQAELSQVWAPTQAVMYLALRTWYAEKTEREEGKERGGVGERERGVGGGGGQTDREKEDNFVCVMWPLILLDNSMKHNLWIMA